MKVVVDWNLELLKVSCKQLALEGEGSVGLLELNAEAIEKSKSSEHIFRALRSLTLRNCFGSDRDHLPSISFDSLQRAAFIHFHETTVNWLLRRAPGIKEVWLEGLGKKEELRESDVLRVQAMTLRLLNIEKLDDVKEIQVETERSRPDITIVKGTRKTEVTILQL